MSRYVTYMRLEAEDQGQSQVTLATQEEHISFFLEEYAGKGARIVLPMRQRGATLRDIADVLNRTGLVTLTGTAWRPAQVSRLLQLMQ